MSKSLESGALGKIDLFKDVSSAQREEIERACRWKSFKAGESIVERFDESDSVYFIVCGSVRISAFSSTGKEVFFFELGPGECFGHLSAIDGLPREASAAAVENVRAAVLSAAVFIRLCLKAPQIGRRVLRDLARVTRAMMARVLVFSSWNATVRVYAELLRRAKKAGIDGCGAARIASFPTHAVLAGYVGVARETATRALGTLARQGVVRRERDALVVTDAARLEALIEDAQEAP